METSMNYLIETIIDTVKYQWIEIELPPTTEKLFFHYGFELEMIEPQEFMVNSIKNYLDYNGRQLQTGDIREVSELAPHSFMVMIPRILWLRLWLLSRKLHVSFSAIVNEALGHSLPLLMEIEEVQEDLMFEQLEQWNR